MKPKTVFICFDSHTPYLAFRVSKLAAALRKQGLERELQLRVVLIGGKEATYGWKGEDFEELYGGVPVSVLSKTFRGLGMRAYFKFSTIKTTLKFLGLLIRHRPKMVLVGGYDRPESILAALSAWLFRWRVGVMHDSRFNDAESYSKNVRLERLKSHIIRRYHFFMCSGQECVDYSNFMTGAKRPAYRGAWNVVDNEDIARRANDGSQDSQIYEQLGIPERSGFFLMPIRFIAKKNVDRVLAAFAQYTEIAGERAIPLVICGQGELEHQYRQRIASLGIEALARVVPWLAYEQVPRACRLSSSVILASTHDQWGLIVNEALAAGAPALVSNRCGAHELVRNGVNGFTFAPQDSAHLRELMERIAGRPELLAELRANAAPSMRSFSIEGFLAAYFDAFARFGLISAQRSRPAAQGSVPASPQPASGSRGL